MHPTPKTVRHDYKDNTEPAVDELLRDPIIRQLMTSDQVSPEFITRLQESVALYQQRLASFKSH